MSGVRPHRRGITLPAGDSGLMRVLRGLAWAGTHWPATVAALALLASSGLYGAVLGGHFEAIKAAAVRFSDGVAAAAGLSAYNVSVSGLRHAGREDVLAVIGIAEGGSIVAFDARKARRRLEAQDWVASASIQRQFPNTLHVEIVERSPFALWQKDGVFHVIDEKGVSLSGFAVRDHLGLPIVVGKGAERGAYRLVNELEAWDGIRSRVRAAVLVAERRWNLYLDNGIKVLLPEEDVEQALRELDRLNREQELLSRAVELVDLRLSERTTLRLSDEAVAQRNAGPARVSKR